MAKFNNNDLKNDIEKIKGYNTAEIKSSCDKNLDAPYILDINDSSYFYTYREERDVDFERIKAILKNLPFLIEKNDEANGRPKKFTLEEHKHKVREMIVKYIDFSSFNFSGDLIQIHPKEGRTFTQHWFEFCFTTLAEKVIQYNHQKMGDMAYQAMLGNTHPVDFLYKVHSDKK